MVSDEKVVEDVQNTGSVKAETVDQVELSATSGNKDEEKIVPEGKEKAEPATGILHEVLNNVVYPAVQAVQHAVFQEDGGDSFGTPRNSLANETETVETKPDNDHAEVKAEPGDENKDNAPMRSPSKFEVSHRHSKF